MIKAQETQKRYYDQFRRAQDFQMLDLVMVKSHAPARENTRKFSPSRKGPFVILKLLTHDNEPRAVEVLDRDKSKAKRVAFQDLKHYVIRTVKESSENIPGVAIQHAIQNSVQGNQHGPEAPVSLIANYDSNTYNDKNFSSLQETRVLLDTSSNPLNETSIDLAEAGESHTAMQRPFILAQTSIKMSRMTRERVRYPSNNRLSEASTVA